MSCSVVVYLSHFDPLIIVKTTIYSKFHKSPFFLAWSYKNRSTELNVKLA